MTTPTNYNMNPFISPQHPPHPAHSRALTTPTSQQFASSAHHDASSSSNNPNPRNAHPTDPYSVFSPHHHAISTLTAAIHPTTTPTTAVTTTAVRPSFPFVSHSAQPSPRCAKIAPQSAHLRLSQTSQLNGTRVGEPNQQIQTINTPNQASFFAINPNTSTQFSTANSTNQSSFSSTNTAVSLTELDSLAICDPMCPKSVKPTINPPITNHPHCIPNTGHPNHKQQHHYSEKQQLKDNDSSSHSLRDPHCTLSDDTPDDLTNPTPRCQCALVTLFRQHGMVFIKLYLLASFLFTLGIAFLLYITNSTQYCFQLLGLIPWGIGEYINKTGKAKKGFLFFFIVSVINNLLEPIRIMVVLWLLQVLNDSDTNYVHLQRILLKFNSLTAISPPQPLLTIFSKIYSTFLSLYAFAHAMTSIVAKCLKKYLFNPLRYAFYSFLSSFFSFLLTTTSLFNHSCFSPDFRQWLKGKSERYRNISLTFSRLGQYNNVHDPFIDHRMDTNNTLHMNSHGHNDRSIDDMTNIDTFLDNSSTDHDLDLFLDDEFDLEYNLHHPKPLHTAVQHNTRNSYQNLQQSQGYSSHTSPPPHTTFSAAFQQSFNNHTAIPQIALPVHQHQIPTLFDHVPASQTSQFQHTAHAAHHNHHIVNVRSNFAVLQYHNHSSDQLQQHRVQSQTQQLAAPSESPSHNHHSSSMSNSHSPQPLNAKLDPVRPTSTSILVAEFDHLVSSIEHRSPPQNAPENNIVATTSIHLHNPDQSRITKAVNAGDIAHVDPPDEFTTPPSSFSVSDKV